ncbi:MAG: gliding motility-associated C-terminal domain-containing protein [Bacteroidetes bacterium]|nr:gliding motility-associated C-terminal domain-containing protein [Bacteroidota bacterium]
MSILTNETQLGCSGDTFGAVTFDSTVANTTYQWELQNTTVPLLVSGYPTNGNGDFPSLVLENGLTMAFTLIYEVTPTAAGCEGPPLVFEITINPVPVLLFSDNDQILCNMDASAPVTISSTTPDVNIQWTIPNPPNAADLIGVSQLSGAASIPSMVLENKTQAPIDLVFEASATTNDASACPGSNFYYTITVLPSAEINPISDEIVCSTYPTPVININTPTSPSGSITYTWDVTFAGLNLSGYLTSGLGTQIPTQVVQNATNVVERLEYTITPYINGCPGIVEVVNLFIDPTPEIQDMTATICSEDTFDVLPVNDSPIGPNIVPAGTTYTWTVAANNDVEGELAQTVPQSSISQDLINRSHVDQIVTYTVEPTTVDGCIGQTFQVDITVEPRPIVTDKFESICSGDAFDVVPVNTPPGQIVPANTLYTWTVSTNPFIFGSSDQTTPVGGISQILTSISDVTETIVYTVTPISGSCIGLDFDITVSVSPRPFIEDVVLTPICSEDTFVYVPVTGIPNASIIVPAGTTYTWTVIDNLNVIGDTDEPNPQTSISQTLENTTSVIQTVVYEVTPLSNGCQGPSFQLTVDVKPRPHVTNVPQMTNTQCSGDAFVILPQDGIPDAGTIIPVGTAYTWVVSSPNFDLTGWSDNSTPLAIISQTLVNTTNIQQQIGYTITPQADGCIGDPFDVIIWVEPTPYIPNVIQTLCDSESYVLSPVNGLNPDSSTIVPNITTYTWSDPVVVGSIGAGEVTGWNTGTDAAFFDSGVLENNTTNQQTVIFTVTPTYAVPSNPLITQCVGDDFTITITLNPSPEINEVITNVGCSYTNPICGASIELNPIGGNPFTYLWEYLTDPTVVLPNPTDEDQYDLCPGDYQVTVFDDFGCSYVFQYTIEPPTPIDFQLETLVNISCNNVNVPPCDGYIDLGISGGTAPYVSLEWYTESVSGSNIFDVIVETNSDILTNACEGNYVLVVIDDNGCEFTSPIYTIENLNSPIIVLNEVISDYNNFEISCNGLSDGFVHVDLSGGSGIFTYTFQNVIGTNYVDSDPSTPDVLEFDNLPAGDYTLTITDSNCPYDIVRNYTLTEPVLLLGAATLISDPIDCNGDTETYSITASGGVPPYTGTGTFTFAAGVNNITITDSNGCSTVVSVTVVEPPVLTAVANVISPIICFGETATIEVVASGGTPPYTGDGIFTPIAGLYVFTVTDANGCIYTDSILIDEPGELTFTIDSYTNPTCSPDWSYINGSICITITGGTNPVPVGVGWVSYGNGQWCWENLSDGTYSVTVTDDNSCPTKKETITLNRPPAIDAFITSVQSVDCAAQTITQTNYIFVDGGTPPYTITWSGGDVCDPATQQCMQTTVSGTYTAFIHDMESLANGCPPIEVDVVVDLEELGDPSFTYSSPSTMLCNVLSFNDPIQFTDTSTGDVVSVDWDFGDGTAILNEPNPSHIFLETGTYTVTQTVNYPYGCSYSITEDITITKGYEMVVPNAFTPNGDGINDTIRPVFNCMTEVTMSIYDTWGGLLFMETGEDLYGWDGLIDGRPAENGNYIIVIKATTFQGLEVNYNGPITLLK